MNSKIRCLSSYKNSFCENCGRDVNLIDYISGMRVINFQPIGSICNGFIKKSSFRIVKKKILV